MKMIKKAMKILLLVVLISLACIGIGVAGAVPLQTTHRRDNTPEIKVELIETDKDDDILEMEFRS